MPTGYEHEQWRATLSIAKSLDIIATELQKLNKDGIRINKIDGLVFDHDCVPIVDFTKP